MVVQAQHPSNVLLPNRNGQEQKNIKLGGDCLLRSSQAGRCVHQSVLVDNEGGFNPLKRGREAPINLSSLQLHHPYTGLRFSSKNQQQNQQPTGLLLSSDLSSQIKHQADEIDQLLQAQGEQLRRMLAEKRRIHYRALLRAAEESASRMLREKFEEMEEAVRRNAELEELAEQLKAEATAWEAKAREQQAAEALLQAKLREAIAAAQAQDKGNEIGCGGGDTEDAESACIDPRWEVTGSPLCRACRKRYVSVVLLPCRHLCVCGACESGVKRCPLCHSDVSASVEAYLS